MLSHNIYPVVSAFDLVISLITFEVATLSLHSTFFVKELSQVIAWSFSITHCFGDLYKDSNAFCA
jgi:hypothetical protein